MFYDSKSDTEVDSEYEYDSFSTKDYFNEDDVQIKEQYEDLISESFPKIINANNQNIVIVLGKTGAGKSTTVGYLQGRKFKEEILRGNITYAVPIKTDHDDFFPSVGHGVESHTLYPSTYTLINTASQKFAFCDCPGFSENRGEVEEVYSDISRRIAINSAKNISAVMVVIECDTFYSARGEGIRDIALTLGQFFKNPDAIADSIVFVITKTNGTKKEQIIKRIEELIQQEATKLDNQISTILKRYGKTVTSLISNENRKNQSRIEFNENDKAELSKAEKKFSILRIINNNQDKMILVEAKDLCDIGYTRNKIINQLRLIKPIPKDQFNFSEYDENQIKFNKIISPILNEATDLIQKIELNKKLIQSCKNLISEFVRSSKIYQDALSNLQNRANRTNSEKVKEDVSALKNQRNRNSRQIELSNDNIADVEEKIRSLENELKLLECDEPVLYRKLVVDDKRHPLGFLGYTSKELRYEDIPFEKVETTCQNGAFRNTVSDPEHGKYHTKYESDYYKDGIATVKILVRSKNQPDNALRIKLLKDSITELTDQIVKETNNLQDLINNQEKLKGLIEGLENENKTEQQIADEIDNFEEEIERLDYELNEAENNLKILEKEQSKLNEGFKKRKFIFDMVGKISKILNIQANKNLAEAFDIAYANIASYENLYSNNINSSFYESSNTPDSGEDEINFKVKLLFDKLILLQQQPEILRNNLKLIDDLLIILDKFKSDKTIDNRSYLSDIEKYVQGTNNNIVEKSFIQPQLENNSDLDHLLAEESLNKSPISQTLKEDDSIYKKVLPNITPNPASFFSSENLVDQFILQKSRLKPNISEVDYFDTNISEELLKLSKNDKQRQEIIKILKEIMELNNRQEVAKKITELKIVVSGYAVNQPMFDLVLKLTEVRKSVGDSDSDSDSDSDEWDTDSSLTISRKNSGSCNKFEQKDIYEKIFESWENKQQLQFATSLTS